jgi:hypothetical protein
MGPHKEIPMKGALAGLVAMALAAATSATALAQTNKEASPGAVTSGSTAMSLPAGGNNVMGAQVPQSGAMTPQSPAIKDNTGVAETNGRTTEKGRIN